MDKLLVLDGNSIINRAFYGVKVLTNSEGQYTNAVYGFLNILLKQIEDVSPTGICVAFDVSAPTFRHKMYDEYKAHRKGMPDELKSQMPILKEVLSAMNIAMIEKEGYEADDIIGTIAARCEAENIACKILTGDKDDLQLATDNTKILLIITKKGVTDTKQYDEKAVCDGFRITPKEFIQAKALMGDPSDNIPGVVGVGEKTAFDLIERYKTLEGVYLHLDELSLSLQKKLIDGKEIAFLSRELSTIKCNVPVKFKLSDFEIKPYNNKAVIEVLKRLEFASLLKRLKLEEEVHEVELTTIDQMNIGETVCYSLFYDEEVYFAVDGKVARIGDIEEIRGFFEDASIKKVGHNIKDDIVFLAGHGIEFNNIGFDTMLGAYILSPGKSSYNLPTLAREHLKREINGANSQSIAAINSEAVKELYENFSERIRAAGQENLYYSIEIPLLRVLADMQIRGFAVDTLKLTEFGKQLEITINEVTKDIYEIAECEFNINSPKQLGEVLFEKMKLPVFKKTKTGYSTDAEVLRKLCGESEIIDKILEFRKVSKLKSTYVDGLLTQVSTDGRIHSSFNQAVTVTGRISSTEPNLQNIPVRYELGREIRRMFVAESPDFTLLDGDYSQIELRVLAHIANDEAMIEAFRENMDIHTKTAAEVFDVAPQFVTDEMRSRAKAVNFGIVYGISDYGLADDLGITRREAKRYIDGYLSTFKGVRQYMTDIVEEGKANGYVTTLFGRKRYIPELGSNNFNLRAFGERAAMNTPIQGSAADIIKIAMIRVHERLKGYKSRLILQVHDELIIEAHCDELDEVREILVSEMESAATLGVALVADVGVGDNWFEAK